jgi:hypothetical protein
LEQAQYIKYILTSGLLPSGENNKITAGLPIHFPLVDTDKEIKNFLCTRN